jgi:cytochrome c oxidase subunit IV
MSERLEAASDFVRGITAPGGEVSSNVDLYGGQGIGDVIEWSALMRFAVLKADLGVEVLPTMQKGR